MKSIGIQIKSNEAILIVLEKDALGNISQTNESVKFDIADHKDNIQIKQFQNQIKTAFDHINASRIGIIARLEKGFGQNKPSPVSFKLEGIIQLYDKIAIEIVSPQTLSAYYKKNPKSIKSKLKYQENAFDLAYYLIK